jgi:hypothetical protein
MFGFDGADMDLCAQEDNRAITQMIYAHDDEDAAQYLSLHRQSS